MTGYEGSRVLLAVVAMGLALVARTVLAQSPTGAPPVAVLPQTVAVATESPPLLDGVVLGDPAWADAVPASEWHCRR